MSGIYVQTIGTGRPLVLVHGWAMHSGVWGDFAKELAKSYMVICVDLPGHGQSTPIKPFTLKTIAAELVETVHDKHCCWLGWSLGAQVVLQIAADFPERVDKLILLAGTPCFVGKKDWPGMSGNVLEQFAQLLAIDGKETLLRFLSLQVKDTDNAKKVLTVLKAVIFNGKFPDQQTLQDGLQILKHADLRPIMAKLRQQVCAILGTHDALVSPKTGTAMQQLLPSLQLQIIGRAGHTPFLSHSAQVIECIGHFMDSH